MKIEMLPYDKNWVVQYKSIKQEILTLLHGYDPIIEHFGSTAIPDMHAKPVIDILVGIHTRDHLDEVAEAMLKNESYLYYKAFNKETPKRRLLVKLKDGVAFGDYEKTYSDLESIPHDDIHQNRIAHIHIWENGSYDWMRHIAFRNYLKKHPEIKKSYSDLKLSLCEKEWSNGLEYSDAKYDYLSEVESEAIDWYLQADKI